MTHLPHHQRGRPHYAASAARPPARPSPPLVPSLRPEPRPAPSPAPRNPDVIVRPEGLPELGIPVVAADRPFDAADTVNVMNPELGLALDPPASVTITLSDSLGDGSGDNEYEYEYIMGMGDVVVDYEEEEEEGEKPQVEAGTAGLGSEVIRVTGPAQPPPPPIRQPQLGLPLEPPPHQPAAQEGRNIVFPEPDLGTVEQQPIAEITVSMENIMQGLDMMVRQQVSKSRTEGMEILILMLKTMIENE